MKRPEVKLLTKFSQLERYFAGVNVENDLFSADTETIGLSIKAPIIGFCFYDGHQDPVFAATDNLFPGIPEYKVRGLCNEFFPQVQKTIMHNGKYDLGVLKWSGYEDLKLWMDTIPMIHVYDPDLEKKLETCVYRDLGTPKQTYEQVVREIHPYYKTWSWNKVNWEKDILPVEYYKPKAKEVEIVPPAITLQNMGQYGGEDAYDTYRLYKYYEPKLTDSMWKLLHEIEVPLVYTLRDAHHEGVRIDTPVIEAMQPVVKQKMIELDNKIYEDAGVVFNPKSPKQLAEVLYDKLGYPCSRTTKSGGRSTDAATLGILAEQGYPIATLLVERSKLSILRSNYIDKIPLLVDEESIIRCNLNAAGARTSRLSSDNPNLQNQPNSSTFPIRRAFVPKPGNKLIVADLSQIELRIIAHVSKDREFARAFFAGEDIHQQVGDALGISRKGGKTMNFAVVYGVGAGKVAVSLGVTKKRAQEIIDTYYEKYPDFARWKKNAERRATRDHAVYSMFNRIRRLPNAKYEHSREFSGLYYQAMRQAVNTAIQGAAADYIKIAMNNTHREFKRRNMRSALVLQVHDELMVDAPIHEVEEAHDILVYEMENAVKLNVPIVAESKVVNTWYDMKDDDFVSLLPQFKRGGLSPAVLSSLMN